MSGKDLARLGVNVVRLHLDRTADDLATAHRDRLVARHGPDAVELADAERVLARLGRTYDRGPAGRFTAPEGHVGVFHPVRVHRTATRAQRQVDRLRPVVAPAERLPVTGTPVDYRPDRRGVLATPRWGWAVGAAAASALLALGLVS